MLGKNHMAIIQIELPPSLYHTLEALAQRQHMPIEALARDVLSESLLPTPDDLEGYSDAQLSQFLAEPFNTLYQDRIDRLTEQAKMGTFTQAQRQRLDYFLALYAEYIVLRSKALALLKERGHDLTPFLSNVN